MRFSRTSLDGVVQIDLEKYQDMRGYFARTWCDREAAAEGLVAPMVQNSLAFNDRRGTLRGLHYHAPSFPQVRVVRCIAGAIFLAVVDLRPDSSTFRHALTFTLDAEAHTAVYVPPSVAIGYQTVVERSVVHYQMTQFYDPQFERGVRWNDPAFGIEWPNPQPILNERDAAYPDFQW